VPKFLLKTDCELGTDLYFHLPENQTVVFFRGKGHRLSPEDMRKIEEVQFDALLTQESQRDALTQWMGRAVNGIIDVRDAGPDQALDSKQLEGTANVLIGSLEEATKSPYGDETPDARNLLSDVSTLVEQVVVQFKKARSAKDYEELLRASRGNALDPLQQHQRQVSAMSVMIMMSSGAATMNELADLGAAGLVHDLGLGEITLSIRDRHVVGMDGDLSSSEKLVHLRHTDLTLARLKARGIKLSPGALEIITKHHENWDGTGFKGITGPNIPRAARALRIADDLVSWMSNIMNFSGGLFGSFAELVGRTGMYDPELMASFGKSMR
jgi:HD-GYP domain-containing protein (c-di-GMP phosphodiesterase class II)